VRRNSEMRTALWARDILRLPIRIIFTSAATRRHSAHPRWLISRMDAVIATSQAAADCLGRTDAVIPHGVDPARFAPAADRASAWAATGHPGTRGIATIGRIRPEKGSDRFVDAMLSYLPQNPQATALLIGRAARRDQGYLRGLKAKVARAGLTDRILFPGQIAPHAMPTLLQGLSAVVQLPRYEGYGMAPLEGIASGVPFVATDQGNFRAFSDQGRAGLIVPGDDTHAITCALDSLLDNAQTHLRMAEAGRILAQTRFSITSEVNAIDALYQKLWNTR
jgi:mannosyltransferase